MSRVAPLAMSEKKQTLLAHLNMAPETYNMMGKEVNRIYDWLVDDKSHLKGNGRRKPPYDWSDISEKAKDEAIRYIAESQDAHTRYYWDLAEPTPTCSNWIARWFIYHKFRYRDGRSRSGDSSKHDAKNDNYYTPESATYYHNGAQYAHPSYQNSYYDPVRDRTL